MKKIYTIFILIFILLLLSFNSECFGATAVNQLPSGVTDILANSPYYTSSNDYIVAKYIEGNQPYYFIIFFPKDNTLKFYVQQNGQDLWLFSNKEFTYYNYTINYNYSITDERSVTGYPHNYSTGFLIRNNEVLNSVIIYSNNSYSTAYYDINLYEGGSSEDNPDYDNIFDAISDFFGDFWNNVLHIVVPSEQDFSELQSNFSTKILSKFTITKLTRSSDYSNNDKYPSINYNNKMPIINIMGFEYDTTQIATLLDTPINFGSLRFYSGMTENNTPVNTGGLTARTIINLLIAIEICTMNIVLYNKFFNKGE